VVASLSPILWHNGRGTLLNHQGLTHVPHSGMETHGQRVRKGSLAAANSPVCLFRF
jgi:hypothetical protein